MIYKYVTYHIVLFIKGNYRENTANQRDKRASIEKSLQRADLTKKSQVKSYQKNKINQKALIKESYLDSKADQKVVQRD